MKPDRSDTRRPYLTNSVGLSEFSRWAGLQIFCRSISPARYSDARIESAKIVIVGFCHPRAGELRPIHYKQILVIVRLAEFVQHALLRIVPHPARAHFMNAVSRRIRLVILRQYLNPMPPTSSHAVFTASFAMLNSLSVYFVSTCRTGIPHASLRSLSIAHDSRTAPAPRP